MICYHMSYRLVSEGIADYASVWVRFLSSKKKKRGGDLRIVGFTLKVGSQACVSFGLSI